MVPDKTKACVGLEYFCFEGDDLWTMDDDKLVELATKELEEIGLARKEQVVRGFAVRVPKAYPMYDHDYADRVAIIREWLERLGNPHQGGQNPPDNMNTQE